jgi:adenosyl cobinamide kinase/adenosyl cobinamide phosphate guanylyltransferase
MVVLPGIDTDRQGYRRKEMDKNLEATTTDELKAELKRLQDNLCDLEDMHSFTFVKTSVHIGAEKAQNMTAEFEEECGVLNEQIAAIEKMLRARGIL